MGFKKIAVRIFLYLLTLEYFCTAGRLIAAEVNSGEESPDTIGKHSG